MDRISLQLGLVPCEFIPLCFLAKQLTVRQNPILRPGAGESGSLSQSTHYSGLRGTCGSHGQGLNSTLSTGAPSISYSGATLLESPLDIPPHLGSYVDVSSFNSYQQGSSTSHAIPRRMLFCDPASQVSTMDSGNFLFGPEEYQDTSKYPAPPALWDSQVTWHSTFHFFRAFHGSPFLLCRRRS
jgi:hypothetical protein